MAARACLFLLTFLSVSNMAVELPPELVVWNIGQGQWVTLREEGVCWHFDMGGEFAPQTKIRALCHHLENRVSLSHWDNDHIGFLYKALHLFSNLCRLHSPVGEASDKKMELLERVPLCKIESPFSSWVNPGGKTANDKSWVHLYRGVLVPGDSPRKQERIWIGHISDLSSTRIVILGHHGSRTSSSKELLNSLPLVKTAVSSARFRRYGHPHAEVVRSLREKRIPLLRTEEWGSIHFLL